MLGNEFYKIEANCELSNERLKSLIFFYGPLVGHEALILYEYLVLRGSTAEFDRINNLLMFLNISIDRFEERCGKLNEYRLLKTLKNENKYILIFNSPLTILDFTKDKMFVRNYIIKTSGEHYKEVLSSIHVSGEHKSFTDVSKTLSLDDLKYWTKNDETYLKDNRSNQYSFNTRFDVNVFLKDISTNLFPLKFRTEKNMKQIATFADLYNISYDKMRTFLPKIANPEADDLDFVQLKYLCVNAKINHSSTVQSGYDMPCILFLEKLQNGKEATMDDKRVIYNLANSYHLSPSVINVLVEHTLKKCDNRLYEKYIYKVASDLYRNNIVDAKSAISALQKPYNKSTKTVTATKPNATPKYSDSSNVNVSKAEADELLRLMGKK